MSLHVAVVCSFPFLMASHCVAVFQCSYPLVQLSLGGHLDFFMFSAMVNQAALNMFCRGLFVDKCVISLGRIDRSEMPGS